MGTQLQQVTPPTLLALATSAECFQNQYPPLFPELLLSPLFGSAMPSESLEPRMHPWHTFGNQKRQHAI